MAFSTLSPHVQVFQLKSLLDSLVDFSPYLARVIKNYENSPIPQYYVDLSCQCVEVRNGIIVRDSHKFRPVDQLIDQWLTKPGAEHLSILGDFGMGKSWLARRLAYKKSIEYIQNPTAKRIPIFFDLSNIQENHDIEDSIILHLQNHGVRIKYPHEAFSFLNEQGKLLIILDSFDQMAQRADSYLSTVENFWKLSRLINGKSKIILMSRTHYFRHLAEEVRVLQPISPSIKIPFNRDNLSELGLRDGKYRLVHLLPLENDDIRIAIQKRIPEDYASVYDKIQSIYDLGGLAGRPVLLDLITKIFPQIESIESVNQLVLYETYFSVEAKRGYKPSISYTTPNERLEFTRDLAWDMFIAQKTSISAEHFSEKIKQFFNVNGDLNKAKLYEQEIRTQLYLIRDDHGNIGFGHESFKEFMAAKHVAEGLKQGQDLVSMLGENPTLTGRRLYLRGIYKFVGLLLSPSDEGFLLELVNSPHVWERFLAIYLLGRPKNTTLKPKIIDSLSTRIQIEPDIMTRRELCYALARLGHEGYMQDFVKEIKRDHELMEKVYAIGYFDYHQDRGGPVEEIRWRLTNKIDQSVRVEYIHFLGEYGDDLCIPAIQPYLQDKVPDVQQEAKEALDKLRHRKSKES